MRHSPNRAAKPAALDVIGFEEMLGENQSKIPSSLKRQRSKQCGLSVMCMHNINALICHQSRESKNRWDIDKTPEFKTVQCDLLPGRPFPKRRIPRTSNTYCRSLPRKTTREIDQVTFGARKGGRIVQQHYTKRVPFFMRKPGWAPVAPPVPARSAAESSSAASRKRAPQPSQPFPKPA